MPGMVGKPLDLGHRVVDADRGHERGPAEPVGRVRAERREVVVVDARHREVELAIGRVDDPVEAVREEELGVDAVEVEGLDARLGVVAAGVDVLQAAPQPLLVRRAARRTRPS